MGGIDILREMEEAGELEELIKEGGEEDINQRLEKLTKQAGRLLFEMGKTR